ncbi:MAG: hypothetical protein ACJAYU_003584 [Bradymonadia bacterium]
MLIEEEPPESAQALPPVSDEDLGHLDEQEPAEPPSITESLEDDSQAAEPERPRLRREPIVGERGAPEVMTDRRDAPDLDQREDAKPTPGQRALWIPRVLLAPVYGVTEYVIRRPIGAFALWGEQNHLGSKVANVLTFGTGGRIGVYPTALFDFGLRSSVGLYLFSNDTPREGDHMRMHFAWGGSDWWRFTFRERILLGGNGGQNTELSASRLGFHFVFDQRPDHLFTNGIGISEDDTIAAYKWTRLGGQIDAEWAFGELDGLEAHFAASRNRFGDGDGSIDQADVAFFELLQQEGTTDLLEANDVAPGFDGYELIDIGTTVTLDSRDADPASAGSGVRLAMSGRYGNDVGDAERSWLGGSTHLTLYGDINGRRRVFSVSQRAELVSSLGDKPIPYTELPGLGGTEGLRGYVAERARGESTLLTAFQYTYPVWAFMDGFVFYEVGNAYAGAFEGASLRGMASSFGMGLRSNGDRDVQFSLLFGAGLTPFDADDYGIQSTRILLGAQRGF